MKPSTKLRSRSEEARLHSLERELKTKQGQLEGLRERNLVLERRVRIPGRQDLTLDPRSAGQSPQSISQSDSLADSTDDEDLSPQSIASLPSAAPTPAFAAQAQQLKAQAGQQIKRKTGQVSAGQVSGATPLNQQQQRLGGVVSATVVDASQTGEQLLYSKVLDSYRTHKMDELQKTLQILLKTYPDSVFADNAVYMAGLLAFEEGDLNRADLLMDRVLRDFPLGNKSVSALFAKAMIQKKSRKFADARFTLGSLQKLYPGSPEAARAEVEVKMVEMMASRPQ
jgi:TolA-binding protein